MQKKGIELSLNTIIIASIGLLILVLLAFLVVNYVRNLREGTETCRVKGGYCVSSGDTCNTGYVTLTGKAWSDCKTDQQCCKAVG